MAVCTTCTYILNAQLSANESRHYNGDTFKTEGFNGYLFVAPFFSIEMICSERSENKQFIKDSQRSPWLLERVGNLIEEDNKKGERDISIPLWGRQKGERDKGRTFGLHSRRGKRRHKSTLPHPLTPQPTVDKQQQRKVTELKTG